MRRGREFRAWTRGAVAIAVALSSGCTMIVPSPPPSPSRGGTVTESTPPPDARPGVDLREVTMRVPRRFEEVRGLWVVRFTLTSEEAVRTMVDRAAGAGINTLIVQVRGRADAFYASALEPRGESVQEPEPFDPLAVTIREAHARGIAVHAWVNTHLVWGPAAPPVSPDHLVNANPDWLAVPRALGQELAALDPDDPTYLEALVRYAAERPETAEGVYSNPSHPAVQDRVHAVWMDLARRYELDGIHFDYIRYPSADFDYSVDALERFRLWVMPQIGVDRFAALDAASAGDLFAFVDALPQRWEEFRRAQITGLVERIYRDVKSVRPDLLVSAAVVADPDVAYHDRLQDWRAWLRDGVLDVAVPMAYTEEEDHFAELVAAARAAAGDPHRVWAGIGAYMNPPERTIGMIDVARARDAGGVVLFSYDWVVGEGEDDPSDPLLERIGRARFENR